MTPAEVAARQALTDILGICRRDGSILQRFQAVEDRAHQAQRDLEAAPMPSCDCGEASCARGVCR